MKNNTEKHLLSAVGAAAVVVGVFIILKAIGVNIAGYEYLGFSLLATGIYWLRVA